MEHFNHKCAYCGVIDDPCIYDLHHIDPSKKDFGIARYLDRVWEKLKPELEKCIMLCSNCHRKVHFGRQLKE